MSLDTQYSAISRAETGLKRVEYVIKVLKVCAKDIYRFKLKFSFNTN